MADKGVLFTEAFARRVARAVKMIESLRGGGAHTSGESITLPELANPALLLDTFTRFKIVSVQTDYLACHSWDGTTEGSDEFKVALPWDLRRTPFHGLTVNAITYTYTSNIQRTATSGSITETQVITPPYFAGAEIYAFRAGTGGTGVDASGDKLIWQDVNVAGRAWAVKYGT